MSTLDISVITPERRKTLEPLIDFIGQNPSSGLVFICTHNSRRSQFAQIWAAVTAELYQVSAKYFSGGTEVTSCHLNTIHALERTGILIDKANGSNPKYKVRFSEKGELELWSKLYDDDANPSRDFGAIMTCAHAEENCPFVLGAKSRISLNYEDPKTFDGTANETEAYDNACRNIATEMLYVMQEANRRHGG